jgi:indolepyruvate ferredoxin oxidoreductase
MTRHVSLDDKYVAEEGRVFLTGTQALVRLPMTQMRRDRAAGLNTAAFISGYRGSPLGGYDQQLMAARKFLEPLDIHFQPGLNEDLAATAVWGSQQVPLSRARTKDGVLGMWYGKGPGVDRSGDVFKHANAAGTSQHGGVLAIAGDDHTCKSSSIPHQSDHAFISAIMPVLYPSSVHEFLPLGLLGIAMSRFSGCWVGFKVISETVETTAVVDLSGERREFVLPDDFDLPPGGLHIRWPDPPLVQDERLQEWKGYAARAFARANRVDEVTFDCNDARFGIVASGKAYEDTRAALYELGLGPAELQRLGVRLYKVRMPWPLEPEGIRHFSEGLSEVLVIEERREIIEHQIKQQLFNWRADVRPRIVGKFDHEDRPFLHLSAGLTVAEVARGIVDRLAANGIHDDLRERITARIGRMESLERDLAGHQPPVIRTPYYCAGCPHNTSTRVVEGSTAMAGIGCHYMVQWMDRNTDTITHMGGEGVPWTALSRFTDEKHRFVNLGDGTFFHSGALAIRQSVAADANITYKLLYNDAVAMTGGQSVDGTLTPQQVTHMLYWEGVRTLRFLSDHPEDYRPEELAPGTQILHRDRIDDVMRELRDVPGVSAIVFVQTCAAEKRRRRKRGTLEDPDMRLWISPEVCEGCGDCSVQSNCVAVEPLETEMGRKRRINQSSCNKDYSCLKGFCPSFVTVRGAKPRRLAASKPDVAGLPEARLPALDRTWNLAVAGVGGTGVLTIGAILAMAAHIDGLSPMVLDMAGLAQKGGAVLSHIRIGAAGRPPTEPRIVTGRADLLLAADTVVAVSKDAAVLCDPSHTAGVVNTHMTPVADFVRKRDFDFRTRDVLAMLRGNLAGPHHFHDFSAAGLAVAGDEIASNILMLGYAWQQGLVPVSRESIEEAIRLNKVAVDANLDAFAWGRILAHDPKRLPAPKAERRAQEDMTTEEVIAHHRAHLVAYQGRRLAERYAALVSRMAQASECLSDRTMADRLVRATATAYARVLAPKDEYEVARLLTAPEFRQGLADAFEGDARIALNLAPPFLGQDGPDGRPPKREFGPRIFPVLRALSKMRRLRGTPLDPFGRNPERRAERALIRDYEADAERVLRILDDRTAPLAVQLLDLANQVRGYGPVKAAALEEWSRRRAALLQRLDRPEEPPQRIAAE